MRIISKIILFPVLLCFVISQIIPVDILSQFSALDLPDGIELEMQEKSNEKEASLELLPVKFDKEEIFVLHELAGLIFCQTNYESPLLSPSDLPPEL